MIRFLFTFRIAFYSEPLFNYSKIILRTQFHRTSENTDSTNTPTLYLKAIFKLPESLLFLIDKSQVFLVFRQVQN